jgi:glycosyltransferase involved in cell wall biosynthesis
VKVFIIPSWYPSQSNPIYGTFVAEQLRMMSNLDDQLLFGVSTWGQGDQRFLLYARQPFRSILKRIARHQCHDTHNGNIHNYFTPAFTWTNKLGGNLNGIISANLANLERFISENGRPDVIHVQASYPGVWIARHLSQKHHIPFLVTLRMSPFPFSEFQFEGKLRSDLFDHLEAANQLISTSQSLEKKVRSFGLDHVQTVNNPVDLNEFYPGVDLNNKKKRKYTFLTVGRLEKQKGYDLLLEVMSKVSIDFELNILGEGAERKSLERQIVKNNLEGNVILHGEASRTMVSQYMRASDAYILSSRHETFGNVLVEAMATGIPSVATRCGGPEEIVTAETGILCQNENIEALVAAINRLISLKWNREMIRKEAEKRFSPVGFTNQMKEIYQKVKDQEKG